MNSFFGRRSRLIAAQSAVVMILCILLYIGLLQPTSPTPLNEGSVPGHTIQNPGGNGQNDNGNTPGGNQNSSSGGPGNGSSPPPGGGGGTVLPTPAPPQPGPPSGGGQGPGGDEYASTVASLKAELGLSKVTSP
jgi:hypothetical protein